MTDQVYKEIIKPKNQCSLTGTEQNVTSERIGHFRVVLVRDNWGQYRIVATDVREGGLIASAILFDQFGFVRFKYTLPVYRGHNMTRQLFALACMWAKRKFKHSSNLTEAGSASL